MGKLCSSEKSCDGSPRARQFHAGFTILLGLLILFLFSPVAKGNNHTKQILLLHSYNKGLLWTDGVTTGVESVVNSSGMKLELTVEYMDSKRANDEKHYANLLQVYQHKFKDVKFDVIIASDDNALSFVMDHGLELFGDVPIVFCGLSTYTDKIRASEIEMTGIVERQSIWETLELALALHPKANKMYIITDQTTSGKRRRKQYVAAVEKLTRKVDVEYLGDGSMEDLVERLKNLPEDSVVIHHNFNRDNTGRLFSHREAGRIISEACDRPIYSSQEHNLRLGVVGGYMTVGEVHGRIAGEMAMEILGGRNAKDIEVIEKRREPAMFDYIQLKRFGISEEKLPEESIIINKPFSFYHEYRYRIWSVITVVIVLGGLVVSLSINIFRRRRAERERERLMKSLSAKNEELQSIVYAASHDLRSPLVNILGFSTELNMNCEEMLEKLGGAKLEKEIRERVEPLLKDAIPESLEFIQVGATKMQNLLDGLLQVSRVGMRSMEIKRLHMNELLGKIVQSMTYEIQESGAEVTYETLPACLGDVNLVDRLFTNLLTNALKYLKPERAGQIRIRGMHEGVNSVYCVEDNGMGIVSEHIDNIFELFHRLNPEDKTGGEGLGLTIVMRILDRLDGSIRVESERGKGSKFFVSLPGA